MDKHGGAAKVSDAGNLADRQLYDFLTGGTQHQGAVQQVVALSLLSSGSILRLFASNRQIFLQFPGFPNKRA